jgi:protein-S-isoprenylcysteine O-methyltransferase Ste14
MPSGVEHYTGPIVGALWLSFLLFWLFAAAFTKRSAGGPPRLGTLRLLLALGVVLLLQTLLHAHVLRQVPGMPRNPELAVAGTVLCALGFGFAIWARLHLGRNWGMPMSLREGHELVTSGPYALVRHPIYSGILLALLGTALAAGFWRMLLFLVVLAYLVYSATVEERAMRAQFPDEYPAYTRRTKMLIPFVF